MHQKGRLLYLSSKRERVNHLDIKLASIVCHLHRTPQDGAEHSAGQSCDATEELFTHTAKRCKGAVCPDCFYRRVVRRNLESNGCAHRFTCQPDPVCVNLLLSD